MNAKYPLLSLTHHRLVQLLIQRGFAQQNPPPLNNPPLEPQEAAEIPQIAAEIPQVDAETPEVPPEIPQQTPRIPNKLKILPHNNQGTSLIPQKFHHLHQPT